MILIIRRTDAVPKRIHSRTKEHKPGEHATRARLRSRFDTAAKRAHQVEQLIDVDARRDLFERAETHDALAIDHE